MSDSEQTETPEPVALREGLPPRYRMRADRHYVDQLAASSGQPVRLIPTADIESAPTGAAAVQPLVDSIRRHGILQPLLVRRNDSRYEVIAGRKRLLAAATLQLPTVPCLVQDVGRADAPALAAADNLRVGVDGAADGIDVDEFDRLLASHAAAVRHCADLCGPTAPLSAPALDLVRAHAWRASRLLDAAHLARARAVSSSRERPLLSTLSDIVDGFAPECRAAGITLRLESCDGALRPFNESRVLAGVSGALFAFLPLVANADRPTITLRPLASLDGGLIVQISQTASPVTAHVADDFFTANPSRPGGMAAVVGALAARALARAYGGTAVFEALPHGGSLSISLEQAS